MTISIATWNVNSIIARLPLALRWLESSGPDVVCLQELKCVAEKFPVKELEAAGYHSLIYGQPTYNGVAILVRQPLVDTIERVQEGFGNDAPTDHRRLLAATVGGIRVVNVYVPNGQAVGTDKYAYKLDWLGKLRSYFDQTCQPSEAVLLCGDFNVAPSPLDVYDPAVWEGKILYSEPEKAALQNVVDWGLVDSWRQLHPGESVFSWWDYRAAGFRRNLGLRIDHIWLTPSLMERCKSVEIDVEPRRWERPSDHTPVVASFD